MPPKAKPGGGAKAGGKNAASRAAALQVIEERRKAEEARKKEEEERQAELRRIEEEAKKAEEERLQKIAEAKKKKQEHRDLMRSQGKILTQKEKIQKEKNEIYFQQLRDSGALPQLDQNNSTNTKLRKPKKKHIGSSKISNEPDSPQIQNTTEQNEEIEETESKEAKETEADDKPTEAPTIEDWETFIETMDKKLVIENPPTPNKTENQVTSKSTPIEETSKIEDTSRSNQNGEIKLSKAKTKPEKKEPDLRSPICCILGHVDTGKTKLLDKIRHTNVQDNEAGGITQQIGATFFPKEALLEQSRKVDKSNIMKMPGLLIIDTPGHESFNNLRQRGSSLCDIAILVVDIMHGLEPQTIESIELLKARNCPFVIALNKVDRMFGWAPNSWEPFRDSYNKQANDCHNEFENRLEEAILQLKEKGLNSELYWKNKEARKVVSIAPTSAITGEGIPDLIHLIVNLTQNLMIKNLTTKEELQCTILEVKNIDGFGVTIDVILLNGILHEGTTIVVCGMNGPIVTKIKALLTPQPMKELRVKGEYIHHQSIKAAMGLKIAAPGLEDALAGTSLLVSNNEDDIETLKEEVMEDMSSIFKSIDTSGEGVYVMASTLGSLEALLQYLKNSKVPVFGVNIGTVQKRDVKRASIMKEKKHPQYSVILAFDIRVDPEAQTEADILGVKIMEANIIYHLTDFFTKYLEQYKNEERKKAKTAGLAIFPCKLSILPQYIINNKDPIVMGVRVEIGILKVGTPIVVFKKDEDGENKYLQLGHVNSLEFNKKPVEKAHKGQEVAMKIIGEKHIMYNRHFNASDKLYSKVTRESIDCLKELFRNELTKEDWMFVGKELKPLFSIM